MVTTHLFRLAVLFSLLPLASSGVRWAFAAEPAAAQRAAASERIDRLIDKLHKDVDAVHRDTAARHGRALDSGIAGSKNFTVLAPRGGALAEAVLAHAEALRKEIALEWLREEIAPGRELTHITLQLSDDVDRGTTLLCGPGRAFRGDHRIWLTTSRERALGSTLAHEVTHVVLAARFPRGMAAWANEGIASLRDDAQRAEDRQQLLERWAREENWPSLQSVLHAPAIEPGNPSGYAVAVSLTEYFLLRDSRAQFLKFVERGQGSGWDAALSEFYGLRDVPALQQEWQAFVRSSAAR